MFSQHWENILNNLSKGSFLYQTSYSIEISAFAGLEITFEVENILQ